jgi:hydroxyacyl-ACP dehydratase HTD2-like protein with hotdog domain
MTATTGPRIDAIEIGDEIPSIAVTPTIVQLFLFSAITWNAHRIHYDTPYAATEGYPAPVIHGPFQGGLLSRIVMAWAGGTGAIKRLSYSHRGMALLGDTLTCRGKVTKKYEEDDVPLVDLALSVETQKGEVTTLGRATLAFPKGS